MQYGRDDVISEDERLRFLNVCLSKQVGNSMITPREILRDYMTVLNILVQNPDVAFEDVISDAVTLSTEDDDGEEEAPPADATSDDKKVDLSIFEF